MRFPGWVSPVPRGGYTPPSPRPPLRWSIPHPPPASRSRILIFRAFFFHYKMQRDANPLTYVAISTLSAYRVNSRANSSPSHRLRILPPRPSRPFAPCPRGRVARSPALKPALHRCPIAWRAHRPQLCTWRIRAPNASRLENRIGAAKRPTGFIPGAVELPYNEAVERRHKKSAAYSSAELKMYKIAVRAPGEKPSASLRRPAAILIIRAE